MQDIEAKPSSELHFTRFILNPVVLMSLSPAFSINLLSLTVADVSSAPKHRVIFSTQTLGLFFQCLGSFYVTQRLRNICILFRRRTVLRQICSFVL